MSAATEYHTPEEARAAGHGLAACWQAIGKTPDPWRRAWDGMGQPGRRALLTVAGMAPSLAWMAWDEFGEESRRTIRNAAEKLHAVLGKLLPEGGRA